MKTRSDLPKYLTYDDVLLLPNYSEVTPSKTNLATILAKTIPLEIPVVASPMDTVCEEEMALAIGRLGGLGIIHRNLSVSEQARQVKRVRDKGVRCGAAVGVGADLNDRVKALVTAGVTALCVDSSHGHTKHILEATKAIRSHYPSVTLLSGNVATYEGAEALFAAGADGARVGMGPGSICTTRVVSGMGVPQLTAVFECVKAAKKWKRMIIADGGIRTSGDMVKALAAGASSVMLGSLLAGTDEAPGKLVRLKGKLFKAYRGMGSVSAMKEGSAARYGQRFEKGKEKQLVPEGVSGLVPYRGKLADHLHQLLGGLRSGMAYLGAGTITELQEKARFIKITRASLLESHPYSIILPEPS